jgi:hypothetical protein
MGDCALQNRFLGAGSYQTRPAVHFTAIIIKQGGKVKAFFADTFVK